MNIVTLDFETYYDKDYTLKKLSTEDYIRNPLFEVLGCGVRFPNGDTDWLNADEVGPIARAWAPNSAFLCHHAQFDGLILSHHYGVKPYAWLDTLSMARLLVGNHLSVGLDNLARHFGLHGKTINYKSFMGKRWHDLLPETKRDLAAGCLHDVSLTWDIFNILFKSFPREEYPIVDMTVRMFTEPTFLGDIEMLGKVWTDEAHKKRALLSSLGVDVSDLQSADKFVQLLRAAGCEPDTKLSAAGNTVYAIAKTDDFMKELLEHDDDRIRTLAEGRLGVRSTIDQTRAERLGFMAGRGAMPVYLSYCGAHTTRWSGGDKVNWQNFKRRGGLRKAICAPEGHVIIKADKSQVECRFLNYLADQMDVIERFRNKEDPYIKIASEAYGHPVYKPEKGDPREAEMEMKRGTGKQLELSCGYGAGTATIVATAARGTYGPSVRIDLETGQKWRDLYRTTHPGVVSFWSNAERALTSMAAGTAFSWAIFYFKDGKVFLPNGCPLIYADLHWGNPFGADQQPAWFYRSRRGWKKIWGGYFVENLIQAVSRVDMSQTLLRLRAKGYRAVLLEHDAAAFVVPRNTVDKALEDVQTEFRRSPTWLPDIPLDCDISAGERYS